MAAWVWGVLYAAGAAVYGAWFLREWRRNTTLADRIEELFRVWDRHFGLFLPARFFYYLLLAAQVLFWPLPVALIVVFDVPGFGRNTDEPGGE